MVHVRQLDPSASPLDYFGYEARRLREAAGMTLEQLGKVIYCTGSLIGQVETASKVPSRTFAEALDAAFMTDGFFSRLLKLVLRSQLPKWFQPYAEMEAKAAFISTYQCQVVYGLLQTPEYAAALVAVDHPDRVEELVAARMERMRILEKKQPPAVWVVLDEAVLLREVGSREVMRKQLARLVSFRDNPWVNIQVLPLAGGVHSGMVGSFTLLRFDDDPDIYYSESYDQAHMTANPDVIRERSVGYARLQAGALSVDESADLIARVMEERYGDRAEDVA
ncbi:Helix-turn-helix domain-containing protein [Streptomyces sp. 3213]|uniref:helix-turn-helix domain-containing protein n=1 Tax=Streptomyces sp. 3213.3 TaxID=1855348 RepID=UPI000895F5F9|nr:helix-turn-helix transcriptional regulator [Streptomyces sp. 3213.3]SED96145.1 Helix-turn-helix domain-containing protein [Streptomyces sp. 3213] [Streptomyces sp. 3213.3]